MGGRETFILYTLNRTTILEKKHFLKLIEKHLAGKTDSVEQEMLKNYLDSFQDSEARDIDGYADPEWERRLLKRIQEDKKSTPKIVRIFRYSVAAAAVLLLAGAGWWYMNQKSGGGNSVAQTPETIVPGTSGAVLVLEDGRVIELDSTQMNGVRTLADQAGSEALAEKGRLVYRIKDEAADAPIGYNTVKTPRGRQMELELPDGTVVWLNAGSSIRFPTRFVGPERRVDVTGEVCFRVAPNADQPFISSVKNYEIKVLGTYFNINAYDDEPYVKTSLLEGKVAMYTKNAAHQSLVLSPGQEVKASGNDMTLSDNSDVVMSVSWIRGMFSFRSADLRMVLRQVCRWYDLDVEYRGDVDARFSGSVFRSERIDKLLEIIAYTSDVSFQLEGRKLIVTPGGKGR